MKNSQCQQCHKTFQITDSDQAFYARIDVPEPTHCPDCRAQRRLAYRNERCLYSDKCDLCKKNIISVYSPDKPNPVYCYNCFYSDKWSPTNYGIDFDFNRSFFEQFYELQQKVPRINLIKANDENCEFVNVVGHSKNCYLIFGSIHCEECYYGSPYYCKNSVDTLLIRDCELCYECITSENLYHCFNCQDCFDSNDLLYCYDCRGCSDCIGCAGLRNKKYYIFNKEYSKQEYLKRKQDLNLCNPDKKTYIEKHFNITKTKHPRRFINGIKNEKVIGNYINNSKNVFYSFDSSKLENSQYCFQGLDLKDCMDTHNVEEAEMCYETSGAYCNNNSHFCSFVWDAHNSDYSIRCNSAQDLFGCISIHNNKYCILNKKYSTKNYQSLRAKIIKHMKKTNEWGEFFPIENSPYGYNETVAQEYYPIKEENAREKKWLWKLKEEKDYQSQKYKVLLDVNKIKGDICNAVLTCKKCRKNYKIIPQELKFYKQENLPAPRFCPDCRHQKRMALRTPRAIWRRQCMCTQPDHTHQGQCKNTFETAYPPQGKELVYCADCYNREIY